MSGDANQVHPHTLGMVITAARAIENQLRIQKASKELVLRNNYMRAIIDSIDSGVMAIDKNGMINQINNQGRHILQWGMPLEGKPLSTVLGDRLDLGRMMRPGFELVDQEIVHPLSHPGCSPAVYRQTDFRSNRTDAGDHHRL